jgi:hypothetical protein
MVQTHVISQQLQKEVHPASEASHEQNASQGVLGGPLPGCKGNGFLGVHGALAP